MEERVQSRLYLESEDDSEQQFKLIRETVRQTRRSSRHPWKDDLTQFKREDIAVGISRESLGQLAADAVGWLV